MRDEDRYRSRYAYNEVRKYIISQCQNRKKLLSPVNSDQPTIIWSISFSIKLGLQAKWEYGKKQQHMRSAISYLVKCRLDHGHWYRNLGPWIKMHDTHDSSSQQKKRKSTVEMKWTCNKTVNVLCACIRNYDTDIYFLPVYSHVAYVTLNWNDFFFVHSIRKIVYKSIKEHAN